MRATILKIKGTKRDIADSCRTTEGKEAGTGEPSSQWLRRLFLCEHSPIRKLIVSWKWTDIEWWIQTHFTRHKFGVEWFVKTSRTDRTGIDRSTLTQNSLIDMEGEANAQAIINISRKRLCTKASSETRYAWQLLLSEMRKHEPELVSVCVPECVYRGWCYEYKSCGYHLTEDYKERLNTYRESINSWEG